MTRGTLKPTEAHPSAQSAYNWIIDNFSFIDLQMAREAFASCAIESNRLGEVCTETLNRIMNNEPVSDRYLLGLAWALKGLKDNQAQAGSD